MDDYFYQAFMSPIGLVEITADHNAVLSVYFVDNAKPACVNAITELAVTQLSEYFKGKRTCFDLPLTPQGTRFQEQVWQALLTIDFAQVCSYSDIAQQIDNPKGVRAVGLANSKNPISVIVPCHRVIGKNGSLTGYAGGVDRKAWLLQHEQKHTALDYSLES